MPIFTKPVASNLFGDLWSKMIRETSFGLRIKAENLSILFACHDPDFTIYVDGAGPILGDGAREKDATVTMKMSSDTAHYFWLNKINVTKALASRQIKAKGPAGRILELMRLFKSGQAMYPDYCKKYGLPTN